MTFPKQIQNLIEAFERLPGVGPKTAERLAFYLLHVPDSELDKFASSISGLKSDLGLCEECKNFTSNQICEICADQTRDKQILCVVESPLDVFSLERGGGFQGVYHVLHGLIDPLANIGPDELYINDLFTRLESEKKVDFEVILALNPTMEGEATALYIKDKLKDKPIKITRLGVGLPIGGDMQYADVTTLTRALEGRRDFR